jgi:hypothetical protein
MNTNNGGSISNLPEEYLQNVLNNVRLYNNCEVNDNLNHGVDKSELKSRGAAQIVELRPC